MPRVIIESPYTGDTVLNTAYAQRAMKDCFSRGEVPLAFHLLYPQVLNEFTLEDRSLIIKARLSWAAQAEIAVFYLDLGWSPGMLEALKFYHAKGTVTEIRNIF